MSVKNSKLRSNKINEVDYELLAIDSSWVLTDTSHKRKARNGYLNCLKVLYNGKAQTNKKIYVKKKT